jgi:hypothetical protein
MDRKWRYEIPDKLEAIKIPKFGVYAGETRLDTLYPVYDYLRPGHETVGDIRRFINVSVIDPFEKRLKRLKNVRKKAEAEADLRDAKNALQSLRGFSDDEALTGMDIHSCLKPGGKEFKLGDLYDNPNLYAEYQYI